MIGDSGCHFLVHQLMMCERWPFVSLMRKRKLGLKDITSTLPSVISRSTTFPKF